MVDWHRHTSRNTHPHTQMNDVHKSQETTLQETTISSVHFTALHDYPPPSSVASLQHTFCLLFLLSPIGSWYIQIFFASKNSRILSVKYQNAIVSFNLLELINNAWPNNIKSNFACILTVSLWSCLSLVLWNVSIIHKMMTWTVFRRWFFFSLHLSVSLFVIRYSRVFLFVHIFKTLTIIHRMIVFYQSFYKWFEYLFFTSY